MAIYGQRSIIWPQIFILVALIPLSLGAVDYTGKPLDFVYLDFLLPAFLVVALFKACIPAPSAWYVISIFAAFIWSIVAFSFGEIYLPVSILSMMRLYRPVLLILIGTLFVQSYGLSAVMRCLFRAALVVTFTIFISEILFNPAFPSGRWGGEFLGEDVYGFPNSSAAFYSVLLFGVLVGLYDENVSRTSKAFSLIGAFIIILTIFLSGSRSGAVSAVVLLILAAVYHKLRGIVYLAAAVPVAVLIATALFDQETFRIIFYKVDRTFGSGDFSSGRIDIWLQTLGLIFERPFFGYGFFPFSNFSSYDTPHNQYLELLYKSGVVGMIAFLAPLSVTMVRSLRSQNRQLYLFGSLLVAMGVSCITQPNLSFTPTANVIFLFTGIALAAFYESRLVRSRARHSWMESVGAPLQPEARQVMRLVEGGEF